MNIEKVKIFLLGLIIGILCCYFLTSNNNIYAAPDSVGKANQVGRYQISAGGNWVGAYIIDTQAGSYKKVEY